MKYHFKRIIMLMKALLLCIVLSSSIILWVISPQAQSGKQSLDMKSSLLVSLGFGTALCLCINSRKEE
jgi:cell division septal protein FtsQ